MYGFCRGNQAKARIRHGRIEYGGRFRHLVYGRSKKISPEGYGEYLKALIDTIKSKAKEKKLKLPYLVVEPGRSIVGEAGITLYTVGTIKEIPGVKKYVAVDGGMFDNPRYALYQAKYTPVLASRAAEKATEVVSVAGKCCESGDLIAVNVNLPKAESGDILAILSTGAYNYSMAMNYNRNLIRLAILVREGRADLYRQAADLRGFDKKRRRSRFSENGRIKKGKD